MKIKFLQVIFVAMFLAACSSYPWNIQHAMLTSEMFPARTPAEKIEIFRKRNPPERKYIEIAQLSIREKGSHAPSLKPQSTEFTLAEFKKKAAELGADAVIDVELYKAKTGTVGAGSVSIDGIAVRWK